jgi:hypothetical protein
MKEDRTSEGKTSPRPSPPRPPPGHLGRELRIALLGASLSVLGPQAVAIGATAPAMAWRLTSQRTTNITVLSGNPALANRTRALEFAEKTRRGIAPTLHLVETEHFLIFSAWNVSHDVYLGSLCEQMHQKLLQQFSLSSATSVYVGKCPIYLFWEPAHYARFIADVDHSQELDANMSRADGYHANRGDFSYVVINGVSAFGANQEQAKLKFFHVLVHEGTHAFLHRYVSPRPMPLWVEEGLADFIAATLVPQSAVNRDYLTAIRGALHSPEKVRQVLEKKADLTPSEYGLAQSLVRFLVAQDPQAVIRFVQLLKRGADQKAALQSVYRTSEAQLVQGWTLFWQQRLPRPT